MFRMWAKIFKNNRMQRDMVYCNDDFTLNRTRKVFRGLEEVCMEFDLEHPMWLDATVKEFQRHSKCRFTKDNFIEDISFDYLELEVIEED